LQPDNIVTPVKCAAVAGVGGQMFQAGVRVGLKQLPTLPGRIAAVGHGLITTRTRICHLIGEFRE